MRAFNLPFAIAAFAMAATSSQAVELVKNGNLETAGPLEASALYWSKPNLGLDDLRKPYNQAQVGFLANQIGFNNNDSTSVGLPSNHPYGQGTGSAIPTRTVWLGGLSPRTCALSQDIATGIYKSATLSFDLVYEDEEYPTTQGGGLPPIPHGAGADFFHVYFDNVPIQKAPVGTPIYTVDMGAPEGGGIHWWYKQRVTLDISGLMDGTTRTLTFLTLNDGRNGSNSSAWVDNVSINASVAPVPEPASMAALGMGALALLRRRRRA